jgi:hypothetical protein
MSADHDHPRNLYFGAEDWKATKPEISEQDLAHVRNQRHILIGHVTHKAERLISAVGKTLRDFDGTGNADMALDHIEQTILDLQKLATNLVEDVSAAVDRYGDGMEALAEADASPETPAAAVEPTPQAPAAAGPHLRLDGTPGPSPAQVAARINAALDNRVAAMGAVR